MAESIGEIFTNALGRAKWNAGRNIDKLQEFARDPGYLWGEFNTPRYTKDDAMDMAMNFAPGGIAGVLAGPKAAKLAQPLLSRFALGAPELRAMSDDDLASGLAAMRQRNTGKGLDLDADTGAVRDEIARRNAVSMLGLPEDHTVMDRAAAMGLDRDQYHWSRADASFPEFRLRTVGATESSMLDGLGVHTGTKKAAYDRWRDYNGGPAPSGFTMPLKIPSTGEFGGQAKGESELRTSMTRLSKKLGKDPRSRPRDAQLAVRDYLAKNAKTLPYVNAIEAKGDISHITMEPKNLRSRFAAFDPALRDSANLLYSVPLSATVLPALFGEDEYQ